MKNLRVSFDLEYQMPWAFLILQTTLLLLLIPRCLKNPTRGYLRQALSFFFFFLSSVLFLRRSLRLFANVKGIIHCSPSFHSLSLAISLVLPQLNRWYRATKFGLVVIFSNKLATIYAENRVSIDVSRAQISTLFFHDLPRSNHQTFCITNKAEYRQKCSDGDMHMRKTRKRFGEKPHREEL